ncbi:MAG TPA: EF-hand domain-containing protein [Pirellulales bacterium]|jgi:Ca2+-binding EF-hand superfamily protein|nr:EF-hand domain-containing protein [Pirellulales bacterium]
MNPQQMLQRFDKNGNGQLDPDERQAAMQAMQPGGGRPSAPGQGAGGNPQMQQQVLQRFDKNGNGQLDPEERQAAMQAMQQRRNNN